MRVLTAVRILAARIRRRPASGADGAAPVPLDDLEDVSLYHRAKQARDGGDALDDQTWADLDLDAVFQRLDCCASAVGQQVLYDRLRTPASTEAPLRAFDAMIDAFTASPAAGGRLKAALGGLRSRGTLLLPFLFLSPLPKRLRWRGAYPWLTLAVVALGLGAILDPRLLLPLCALLLLNAILFLVQRRTLANHLSPLSAVNRFVSAATRVSREQPVELSRWFPRFEEDVKALQRLRRSSSWLVHGLDGGEDLGALIRQYLNAFLLLELNALASSLADLSKHAGALERTFEALGTLDAAWALANVRAASAHARPTFRPAKEKGLRMVAATHPLLQKPVANDLSVRSSVILTGSNMSGKSTFLRTVGVNAVLAQTVFTTFTAAYEAPLFHIRSAIGKQDSLIDGKSYHLAELERLRGFLTGAEDRAPRLSLLDELFRGTNTVERIASAAAVLRVLDQGSDLVVVASHDRELTALLEPAFAPFHFRELIEAGALHFDYRLQAGPSSTRNAVALLATLGFPHQVVEEAQRLVQLLDQAPVFTRASGDDP